MNPFTVEQARERSLPAAANRVLLQLTRDFLALSETQSELGQRAKICLVPEAGEHLEGDLELGIQCWKVRVNG